MGDLTLDFQSVQKSIVDASVFHIYVGNSATLVPSPIAAINSPALFGYLSFCTTAARKSRSVIASFPVGFGRALSATTTRLFLGLI